MLLTMLIRVVLLGQMMWIPGAQGESAGGAEAARPATNPSTQPLASAAAGGTSAATSQPSEPQSLLEALDRTQWGKLLKGQERISPEDLGHVEFWVGLVKDPLMAVLGFVPRIFVALIFLLIFWLTYRGVRRMLVGSMKRAHVDDSIRDLLGHLIKWSILGFGLVIACNQVGIQITALLTGVSIIGLAIGFAAQETLANFIAGVMIFWDAPFKVGDWIEIDGTLGKVQRVTFRSTRLLSFDGEVIIHPNTTMLSSKVSNHSAHPANRVNVPIGIAYKESIDAARGALLALTTHDARLCQDPPPAVVVSACADSSVNLILRVWIRDAALEEDIFHEYLERAKQALDQAGIEIPFPQLQLSMDQAAAAREMAA